jgi:hypothetical protein
MFGLMAHLHGLVLWQMRSSRCANVGSSTGAKPLWSKTQETVQLDAEINRLVEEKQERLRAHPNPTRADHAPSAR